MAFNTSNANTTTLAIALNDTDEPYEHDSTFQILSYACTAISVICLCVHITVFCLLPSLRNAPAKMVIFMSIGWIVAEALEIIDENIQTTYISCYIIGVIQQFVYTSIFAWTNIMAYDVQRAFRSQVQNSVSKRRFVIYSLYAWGLPCVIAIASVTIYIEIMPSANATRIDCYYGSPLFSFIMCCVVFPMLFANLVMFAVAVCGLCKTARETRMAVKSKNAEYFGLCVKLAVVLGLPWIVVFIFSLTESRVLSGVAEVFVGLHGVYVFLIFTCKKKIWRLLKRRFGCREKDVHTAESISLKHVHC